MLEMVTQFALVTLGVALLVAVIRLVKGPSLPDRIVATDLVPRMNDYASYLGRPPLLQSSPQGPVPTARETNGVLVEKTSGSRLAAHR